MSPPFLFSLENSFSLTGLTPGESYALTLNVSSKGDAPLVRSSLHLVHMYPMPVTEQPSLREFTRHSIFMGFSTSGLHKVGIRHLSSITPPGTPCWEFQPSDRRHGTPISCQGYHDYARSCQAYHVLP